VSLESKAKTAKAIYLELDKQDVLDPENVREEIMDLLKIRNQKWIPLSDYIVERAEKAARLEYLEEKIVEANKILDSIIEKCQYEYDVNTCEKCCDKNCCEEHALKTALSVCVDPIKGDKHE